MEVVRDPARSSLFSAHRFSSWQTGNGAWVSPNSGLMRTLTAAAVGLDFGEAARLRDEVKRLKQVELAVADDPLARQTAIEDQGGGLSKGTRGRPAGAMQKRVDPMSRPHKPTLDEMGPHFGAGAATRQAQAMAER
jgi:excinuclease ABC subunit B